MTEAWAQCLLGKCSKLGRRPVRVRVSHGSRSGHKQDGRAPPHLPGVPPPRPPCSDARPVSTLFLSQAVSWVGWVPAPTTPPRRQLPRREASWVTALLTGEGLGAEAGLCHSSCPGGVRDRPL